MRLRVHAVSDAREGGQRWLLLFVVLRLAATMIAAVLLAAHRITDHDQMLIVIVLLYGAASTGLTWWGEPLQGSPWWWAVDGVTVLGLVLAGEHWRSPFYLLAVTALVLPATSLRFGRAVAWTAVFTLGYFGVAVLTGIDWRTLETTNRLESFTTHLLLPLVFGMGLAYASLLLRRLESERRRSERLLLEAERRRLARELHDSAKQRLHAAQLVLGSALRRPGDPLREDVEQALREDVEQALRELEVAGAELEESLTDLRRTWDDRTLDQALRQRAAQLQAASGIPVRVSGSAPGLSPEAATHAFHIVSEAMVNAVRHSKGTTVEATLELVDHHLRASVADDGIGPPSLQSTSHGVRSMIERSELLGGALAIDWSQDRKGTIVRLDVPLDRQRSVAR